MQDERNDNSVYKLILALLFCAVMLLISACGKKGNLYLSYEAEAIPEPRPELQQKPHTEVQKESDSQDENSNE